MVLVLFSRRGERNKGTFLFRVRLERTRKEAIKTRKKKIDRISDGPSCWKPGTLPHSSITRYIHTVSFYTHSALLSLDVDIYTVQYIYTVRNELVQLINIHIFQS